MPMPLNMQLPGRLFNFLLENNPELAGDRRRTVMRLPQVLREGTKKTIFVNFTDLCKTYDWFAGCFMFIMICCFLFFISFSCT